MPRRYSPEQTASLQIWLDRAQVRPASNEILIDGEVVRVRPKTMAVLERLIAGRGEVVTKEGILNHVWPHMEVSDGVLTDAVHELRRAFSDNSRDPRFIQTIPRRGYRLLASLETLEAAAARLSASGRGTPRIAVLPFVSLSDEPEDKYFCDGLCEDLINGLGKAGDVEVVARTSSLKAGADQSDLHRIAARLQASHLVCGSLRRRNDEIRVIAHLIEPRTDTEIWSEVYDRRLEDLIAVQDEIARSIVQAVMPHLEIPGEDGLVSVSTSNLEAYREFAKGRYFWIQDNANPSRAIVHYQRALEMDPDFALPHAGMVECYNTFAVFHLMPQASAREASIQHAEQALFLDPQSADTQFAFGYTQFYIHWNWRLAEMAFIKALGVNPNHVLARCFLSLLYCPLRRFAEGHRFARSATRLDPCSPFAWFMRGFGSHYRRDFKDALFAAEQGLELASEDVLLRFVQADSLVRLGQPERALKLNHELYERTADFPAWRSLAGAVYRMLGDTRRAESICGDLQCSGGNGDAFVCSYLLAQLGEVDLALDSLERAERDKDSALWTTGCAPQYDSLRQHPRFFELLQRLGLDTASLQSWASGEMSLEFPR
jgi:TolB-like protein